MAKKKHPLAAIALEDPAGEDWQARASRGWEEAEARAERARAEAENPEEAPSAFSFYTPPALPEWEKSEAVSGDVFGRFVFQPATKLVHDVSRATAACRVDEELPRVFVHFAHELEENVPADAEPHAECMGA